MISRRGAIKGMALLTGGVIAAPVLASNKNSSSENNQFSYCLNTSTISGQKIGFLKELETAAKAGYDGIEIWVRDLERYVSEGGNLSDIKKYTNDLGITIENAIGFAQWAVDDDAVRKAGMEQMKREMDMLARAGCRRIAAPPAGATNPPLLDLLKVAERYHQVLELGEQTSVLPQLEIWGASANLHHISQALFVASAAGHPGACLLPDVYHMFRGGSSYHSLKLISAAAIEMFHFNDFPASIPREQQKDSDRVYPGDGAAPFDLIIPYLRKNGNKMILSLELFNKEYWKMDALEVAKTGLQKMKTVTGDY